VNCAGNGEEHQSGGNPHQTIIFFGKEWLRPSKTLSLTPALSPWRGRIVFCLNENLCDGICRTVIRKKKDGLPLFLLLGGEGQDAGERKTNFTAESVLFVSESQLPKA
jgi:hypothetical protein